jgi:FkbM family methyltransferase
MSSRLFFNRIKYLFLRVAGTKYITTECVPYGLKMKFLLRDGQCRDIYYKYGVYSEDHINRYLVEHLDIKSSDLIIDIGANIGWYSLVLSMNEKPTIVAFEPDTENFKLLTENLRMNNRSNVKAYNKAVSDHEGTLTLYLYKTHNPGRHSFIKQKNSVGTAEVPIVPLDSFLEKEGYGNGPIKLIKIDIEGYEYTALKAAGKMLSRAQYILAEFSPYMMRDIGQEPMDYVKLLQDSGFSLKVIDRDGLHEPDYAKIISENQQVNFLGRRQVSDTSKPAV